MKKVAEVYDKTTEYQDIPREVIKEPLAGFPNQTTTNATADWTVGLNTYTYGGKKVEAGQPLKPDDPTDPSYYKDMVVTPTAYIVLNSIPWREGNIIKYVSRWRKKNGIEDLKKARVYLDQLIEAAENE